MCCRSRRRHHYSLRASPQNRASEFTGSAHAESVVGSDYSTHLSQVGDVYIIICVVVACLTSVAADLFMSGGIVVAEGAGT